jgi:hypothetical protein
MGYCRVCRLGDWFASNAYRIIWNVKAFLWSLDSHLSSPLKGELRSRKCSGEDITSAAMLILRWAGNQNLKGCMAIVTWFSEQVSWKFVNSKVMKGKWPRRTWCYHPKAEQYALLVISLGFLMCNMFVTKQAGMSVTLWAFILEVFGSYLGRDTAYLNWSFSWFSSVPTCKWRNIASNRS